MIARHSAADDAAAPGAGASGPSGISISPRRLNGAVSDGAEDAATSTLRGLIDQAESSAARLAGLVECRAGADARSTRASVGLQERLRVGAQVIKALQAQIRQAGEIAAGIDQAAQRSEARVRVALERLDRREAQLLRLEERLVDTMERAGTLVRTVESAEVNIAVLCRRAGERAAAIHADKGTGEPSD